jgi:ABC-type branched-subunit amino acid transport system substrate-binding protein
MIVKRAGGGAFWAQPSYLLGVSQIDVNLAFFQLQFHALDSPRGLAIEEVNSQGGILGREIRPVVIDGESDETTFARQAERLIVEQDVCTIFGCWTSASRKSVLPIVEKQDHLLIYPTQYEGMEQCPNIFYTGAAPNQQIVPAVRWAFGFLRKKRFFLVGWNSIYSHAVNAVIRDEVEALGGEIIGEEYVLPDSMEVTRLVRTIAPSEPGVIFNSLVGDTNQFYTRLLRAAGITPAKVPTVYFSIGEIELLSLSTRETLGDYAAWNYFQSLDRPENHAFVQKFCSRYGRQRVTADPMEAGYSGVHLWAQAVEAAGTTDTPAIRQALRGSNSMLPVALFESILRINILGRQCGWEKLSKVDNSRSSGVQKNPFDRNLILDHAQQRLGTNFSLGFSVSGMGTGLSLRTEVETMKESLVPF